VVEAAAGDHGVDYTETEILNMSPLKGNIDKNIFIVQRRIGKMQAPVQPLAANFPTWDFQEFFQKMKTLFTQKAEALLAVENFVRSQFTQPLTNSNEVDAQALLILPKVEEYMLKELKEEQRRVLEFHNRDQLLTFIEAVGESLLPVPEDMQK
jgi:HJR/Mrr/RecB family endonuclease